MRADGLDDLTEQPPAPGLRLPYGGMVFTIGYEGRSLGDLLYVLKANRVQVLLDVRENAVSRKPGFAKSALDQALEAEGIRYQHEPLLGNPKENRDGFRNGNRSAARRRYLEHLNNGSRDAYEAFVELAMGNRVALLCFERREKECHRGCIVELAQAENPALPVSRL